MLIFLFHFSKSNEIRLDVLNDILISDEPAELDDYNVNRFYFCGATRTTRVREYVSAEIS